MSEKLKCSFDEENIENIRKSNKLSSVKDGKVYRMVNKGPATCEVKISE